MLYETIKPIVRVGLRWYYRSITVAGLDRVPATGPIFLAVNHPNALVDALVVAAAVERRVRFTAKATIFVNPLAAWFFRHAGVVPLRRVTDEAIANAGGTAPASTSTNGTADPDRNAAAFGAVASALADGAAIVIFPEGKSHDEPRLAPLRTGLARMTLMAQHERGVRGIRIVPVGLLFECKEEPRSRVLMEIGEPLDVDSYLHGQATVAALTDAVAARLADVTMNFETADDAHRIRLVGDTLAALVEPVREVGDDLTPLSTTLSVVRRLDRAQRRLRVADGVTASGDIARAAAFESRMAAFRSQLAAAHIDVHDLGIESDALAGVRFAIREGCIALALLPFVLWGRLTHLLPVRIARALATRNVNARDEPAMRTLVVGTVLVLLSYAVLTAMVGVLAGPWWALLFLLSLIPSATSDFRYGDRLRRARQRARAYFRFRRDPALQPALLAEAGWLRDEAASLERLSAA